MSWALKMKEDEENRVSKASPLDEKELQEKANLFSEVC